MIKRRAAKISGSHCRTQSLPCVKGGGCPEGRRRDCPGPPGCAAPTQRLFPGCRGRCPHRPKICRPCRYLPGGGKPLPYSIIRWCGVGAHLCVRPCSADHVGTHRAARVCGPYKVVRQTGVGADAGHYGSPRRSAPRNDRRTAGSFSPVILSAGKNPRLRADDIRPYGRCNVGAALAAARVLPTVSVRWVHRPLRKCCSPAVGADALIGPKPLTRSTPLRAHT